MSYYLGDYTEDYATLNLKFTTRTTAGVPSTLGGTPVISVYKANGTTQSTAGITLTADFDTVTGLNNVLIDLSADAFYAIGNDYQVVITTGTVNSVSVVGEVVGEFSIENRFDNDTAKASALSIVDTNVDSILVDTAEIGTAGAGLTNIGTIATVTDVTNQVTADMTAISGDSTAADNLESTYDGTGYADGAAPATQTQIGNLAVGSAAVSVVSESDTVTTGTEVNTFAVTDQVDQTYHEISDVAGVMEMYYQFDVGGAGVATDVEMTGRLTSSNDTIGVYAYNWGGASWDQIGSMTGSGGTADGVSAFSLLTRHTGTGANLGKVRVRGYAASGLTSATLYIDQAFVSYAVVSQSVGYASGRVWVDTADGTAGTESYVNGVADNKVLTFADAITIGSNVGIHEYNMSPDSTLTLAANLNDAIVYGVGYALNFAGYDASGTHFYHGSPVNGILLSATSHSDILDSIINDVTINDTHFTNCTFTGTVTMATVSSTIRVIKCQSVGSTAPIFDFGTTAATSHNLNIADFNGHLEIKNFNQAGTDTMRLDGGGGHLVINANCTGGTVHLNGDWRLEDNSGGAVTFIYDDVHEDVHSILVDTGTTLPATLAALNDISVADVLTTQMTEAYAADGTAPTLAEALFMINSVLSEFSITGTTITSYKLDGTTSAATHTLDSATVPTSRTRSS